MSKEEYTTVTDIAKDYPISRATLYRWIDKESKYFNQSFVDKCVMRISRTIFIKIKEFDKFIKENNHDL